jgi:hypothetical protein
MIQPVPKCHRAQPAWHGLQARAACDSGFRAISLHCWTSLACPPKRPGEDPQQPLYTILLRNASLCAPILRVAAKLSLRRSKAISNSAEGDCTAPKAGARNDNRQFVKRQCNSPASILTAVAKWIWMRTHEGLARKNPTGRRSWGSSGANGAPLQ